MVDAAKEQKTRNRVGSLGRQGCAEGGERMPPSVTHMHTPQQSHKSQHSSATEAAFHRVTSTENGELMQQTHPGCAFTVAMCISRKMFWENVQRVLGNSLAGL